MKKRSRKKHKSYLWRLLSGVASNWLVRRTAVVLLCLVLAVNGIVTMLGGSGVYLLSPFHLWNKIRAIGLYTTHVVDQVGEPPLPSSRSALAAAVRRYRVPARLAFAVARVESDFVAHRISHTGAMGLMQLMPDTARELGVKDPFHPMDNADGGVKYLSQLWKKYRGDTRRVAAAYNCGPGRVPRTGAYSVPTETQRYVRRVVSYAKSESVRH